MEALGNPNPKAVTRLAVLWLEMPWVQSGGQAFNRHVHYLRWTMRLYTQSLPPCA